jgi:hypothetical protein
VNNCLTLKNRHTGETLRMWRVRDADDQIILTVEGSCRPERAARLFTCIFINARKEW